ncbi:MAG: adenylate/guanylate cyclase domain-containing protein [Nitrosopumilus sp.]|nr:adenylate/guanylate cyclase domain-containing protein [Nitrosopumilus sp.]MDH3735477.1 adenylate/guanylate cyclase domain-containing protein [Nitrosopumilus sp.]MDH3822687.1 adenylate/guanylate cyclase domain-containing protein [Nitrosopumilus sp.]MDH3833040.1 adenylate/guanylate cyclase domain-containing protein [Nitrosopumilus sp.]
MVNSRNNLSDSENYSLASESDNALKPNMNSSDYLVAFSGNTQNYCVGLVDMVNSTKIAATLGNGKISEYYQIFLNSMSKILSRFGGFVIKNVGDCLVYYPESSKANRIYGFMSCLECSLAMTEYHDTLCKILNQKDLPRVDYRISADYGSVVLMKSNNSASLDMIGPPVNMCSKINHAAPTNNTVIGGDLYSMVRKFDDYKFKEIKGYSLGFKHSYPVYTMHRR